jgi:Family of unknown function (DUF6714)
VRTGAFDVGKHVSDSLPGRALEAFSEDIRATPAITLRGGNAVDEYNEPQNFDPSVDTVSDGYFERYWWGIAHLDPPAWRYYLPHLIEYALRRKHEHSMVIDALLTSLRPPDREPARLASLSPQQESVVSDFLDIMAFDDRSVHQALACTVRAFDRRDTAVVVEKRKVELQGT